MALQQSVTDEVRARTVTSLVRKGADTEDAEDAVQDAICALLLHGPPSSLRDVELWLRVVARRRLVDGHRRKRRCITVGHTEGPPISVTDSPDLCTGPWLESIAGGLSDRLHRTLELISTGSDARCIAVELGISRWAAYKRIQRVRAQPSSQAASGFPDRDAPTSVHARGAPTDDSLEVHHAIARRKGARHAGDEG